MDDLIKVAPNGQWSLVKSGDEKSKIGHNVQSPVSINPEKQIRDAKVRSMVEEFLAAKKAGANKPKISSPPPDPYKGMRPVQIQQGAAAPMVGGRTLDGTRVRPELPDNTRIGGAGSLVDAVQRRRALENAMATAQQNKIDPVQVKQARQAAELRERAQAPVVIERTNITADDAAQSKFRSYQRSLQANHDFTLQRTPPRHEGTYHNESATTYGKIHERYVPYEDKETGEIRRRKIQQQERITWAWDANERRWRARRADLVAPTYDGGPPKNTAATAEEAARVDPKKQSYAEIKEEAERRGPGDRGTIFTMPDDDDYYDEEDIPAPIMERRPTPTVYRRPAPVIERKPSVETSRDNYNDWLDRTSDYRNRILNPSRTFGKPRTNQND